MTRVTNNRDQGAVGIGGAIIEPGATEEVDASASDLRSHPFVQEGWITVSGTPGRKSKKDDKPEGDSKEPAAPDGE